MATFRIEGIDKLLKKLKKYEKKVISQFYRSTMRKSCAMIVKTARVNVPIDTGLLKKSLGLKVKKHRRGVFGISGARLEFGKASKNTKKKPYKYLHLVEKGTSHSAAQPFIIPALQKNKAQINSLWRSELQKVLK